MAAMTATVFFYKMRALPVLMYEMQSAAVKTGP